MVLHRDGSFLLRAAFLDGGRWRTPFPVADVAGFEILAVCTSDTAEADWIEHVEHPAVRCPGVPSTAGGWSGRVGADGPVRPFRAIGRTSTIGGMGAMSMPVRLVAVWAGLVLAGGLVGVASGGGSGDDDPVAADSRSAVTGPDEATTVPPTATTSAAPPGSTTTTAEPIVTDVPVATTTSTTTPADAAAPVTAPPAAGPVRPTFSMSPTSISNSLDPGADHLILLSGEGCTGPGSTGVEYGVVGVLTTEGGEVYLGDYVPAAPDGHWESDLSFSEPGTHTFTNRCQRLDGTVLFEYEPIPFTVTG